MAENVKDKKIKKKNSTIETKKKFEQFILAKKISTLQKQVQSKKSREEELKFLKQELEIKIKILNEKVPNKHKRKDLKKNLKIENDTEYQNIINQIILNQKNLKSLR